jgi:hypothetical protein
MTIRVGVNGFGRVGRNFFCAVDVQQVAAFKGAAPNGIRRVRRHGCSLRGVENFSWLGTS